MPQYLLRFSWGLVLDISGVCVMNKRKLILLVVVLLMSCIVHTTTLAGAIETIQVISAPMITHKSTTNGNVRVYLSSLGDPSVLTLTPQGYYTVNGNVNQTINQAVTVQFSAWNGNMTLNYNGYQQNMGQYFSLCRQSTDSKNSMRIQQANSPNNLYPGDFTFQSVKQSNGQYKLYTIAHIYVENYLYGVLPYEMGNDSGMEALKAQAIAARTFTLKMMKNRASKSYDVVDTPTDQVYKGTPSGNESCVAAINATRGIVITNNGDYTATYCSASNGGQIESIKNAWGTTGYSYLAVKDDAFDYANPNSVVKSTIINDDLNNMYNNNISLINLLKSKVITQLQMKGITANENNLQLSRLHNITPHTSKFAPPSRLYTKLDFSLTVTINQQWTEAVTVTCDIFTELESMLGMSIQTTKNELWSVERNNNSFVLKARRFGHGVGMSHRGAMQMANLGYTYDQILSFYYQGCQREQMSLSNYILNQENGNTNSPYISPPPENNEARGTVVVSNNDVGLYIRNIQSFNGKIIGIAGNGAVLEVLSNNGMWCFVRYGNVNGYAPSNSIHIHGTPSGKIENVSDLMGFAKVEVNGRVNLRETGSTNSRVLDTASDGSVLMVFGHNGVWAHIQYNAIVAYISMDFMSDITNAIPSQGPYETNYPPYVHPTQVPYVTVPPPYVYPTQVPHTTTTPMTENAIVVTQSSGLNLRELPFSGSMALATIPQFATVTVHARGNDWSLISYQGKKGYVDSKYLSFDSNSIITTPIPYATPNPQFPSFSTVVPSYNLYGIVNTTGGWLNMRSKPNINAELIALIPNNTWFSILQYGSEWSQIRYNGQTGYAMSTYIKVQNTPPTENNPVTTIAPSAPPSYTIYASVSTPEGGLNLREAASEWARVLCSIPGNSIVIIEEVGSEWSKINYLHHTGYVMTKYLRINEMDVQPTSGPIPTNSEEIYHMATVITNGSALNVRDGATTTANIIASIPNYTSVRVIYELDEWCYISFHQLTGFVKTSFLDLD